MKAIILSAGYGTRLQPLSDYTPKPLVPILGKPLLWHIITKITASKANWIGINVHYQADKIEAFIDQEKFIPQVILSFEPIILGSGGALLGFKKFIEQDNFFIIHNGDVLSDIPLAPLIAEWHQNQPLCLLALHDHPRCNNVLLAHDKRIIDIRYQIQTKQPGQYLAYTGIAIMHSRILEYVPQGFSDIIDILIARIREGKELIMGSVIQGHAWSDIGTIKDYFQTHHNILINKMPLIAHGMIPKHSVFIDEDVVLGEDVDFRGFVSIGKNCTIKSGSVLQNCILWEGTMLSENTIFSNMIVGKNWKISV